MFMLLLIKNRHVNVFVLGTYEKITSAAEALFHNYINTVSLPSASCEVDSICVK